MSHFSKGSHLVNLTSKFVDLLELKEQSAGRDFLPVHFFSPIRLRPNTMNMLNQSATIIRMVQFVPMHASWMVLITLQNVKLARATDIPQIEKYFSDETHVGQDAEFRRPACEQAGDPVGNSEIECCYPPFGETDQEDRNFKDCQN